ncbi:tripartite motif-containing 46b isoform X3 [Pungitius pungitius]|uniref:tripartite motif-containing 46b isoform X3 n=1 Tax=Pungitius pungitius TaxID=134920 RepID=UPI0018894D4B|nr:tripartite motif-containing 46b isoform X3 [Pungitius pungitius]
MHASLFFIQKILFFLLFVFFVRKMSPDQVSLENDELNGLYYREDFFLNIYIPYGVWPRYIVICIHMIKPGSSFFPKMAEMDLKTGTSTMETLVRTSSNMKSLEHELHCTVCKDIVKQPVVLPCQHSVCLMCASEVLVANGYPPPDLPPEPNSPASTPNTRSPRQARRPTPKNEQRPIDRVFRAGPHLSSPSMPRSPGYGTYPGGRRRKEGPPLVMMFPCVPCGRDVELGEKGLADCLRNLTLERIVERYRHTVSLGSVAVMCQFCKPPQALEATKGCADCRSNFCNECFKLYHPWGTPRAQHEHIQPTLNFRPKVLTCPEHDQEKLQFYCRSCQRLLCPLCKLRRIHTGHKILPVAHAYQALKEKITKEMNYILSNQDTVLSQITQLESSITQTEVNSVSAREQLAQSIRDLTAALAERHASLTQALEMARKKRGEALSAQVAERRGLMEHTGLMAFTQELLKETDQPCFVQAARQTHNRFSSAIENLQHFTLAADPSFRHFQLDVSKELKLLTELNFIQVPLAPVIDTQHTLAYDQLYLCWRLPQDAASAWHFSVEYRRRGVVPGGAPRGGIRGGLSAARWGWQRLDEVSGTSAVIDRLEMDSVYVLRVRGCNKAGFGEYSEEVYLHTPPAPALYFIQLHTSSSALLPRRQPSCLLRNVRSAIISRPARCNPHIPLLSPSLWSFHASCVLPPPMENPTHPSTSCSKARSVRVLTRFAVC